MKPRNLLKHAVPVILALAAGAASAVDYYVVVPLKGKTSAEALVEVSLAYVELPPANVGAPVSFDLSTLLLVKGDPSYAGAGVSWAVTSGALPVGVSLGPTGVIEGAPAVAEAANFQVRATYKGVSAHQAYLLSVVAPNPASCKSLLQANPGTPSGWYSFDPDGEGPASVSSYYCDMTTDGGGWTLVVRQYEASPVAWTGGSNGSSFALSQAQIPAHAQVGFGKDLNPTAVDYVTWNYTTGDIAASMAVSPKSGRTYRLHRSGSGFYNYHRIGDIYYNYCHDGWCQSLVLHEAGVDNGWIFSPQNTSVNYRGFRLNTDASGSFDAYAWTVWVR